MRKDLGKAWSCCVRSAQVPILIYPCWHQSTCKYPQNGPVEKWIKQSLDCFYRILNLFLCSLWTHVMPWHRSCDMGCDRHKSLGSNKRRKSKKEKAEKKLAIWKKANFTPAKAFLISEMTHVCNINSSRSWYFICWQSAFKFLCTELKQILPRQAKIKMNSHI